MTRRSNRTTPELRYADEDTALAIMAMDERTPHRRARLLRYALTLTPDEFVGLQPVEPLFAGHTDVELRMLQARLKLLATVAPAEVEGTWKFEKFDRPPKRRRLKGKATDHHPPLRLKP